MCIHNPACPPADAIDWWAARNIAEHPGQGWTLLCNGSLVFDDRGALLPDGRVAAISEAPGPRLAPGAARPGSGPIGPFAAAASIWPGRAKRQHRAAGYH
jgi:hypothetical protein